MTGDWWLALAGMLGMAVQADAGRQATPRSGETTGCELHVWPGSPPGSVYHGWVRGGIVNGAVDGRNGYPKVPADQLGTETQVALLDASPLATMVGRPSDRVVLHREALDSRTIRTTPGRLADHAGCYAELIVDDVMLKQDIVSGSYLSILYRFRDFGDAALPARTFSTWVKTPLKTVSVQGSPQSAAVSDELQAAYRSDLALFAAALNRPPRTKAH